VRTVPTARNENRRGDVQWLTAGAGVVHSEMFPLLDPNGPNPLELFQIWLNLPAKHKLAPPYFTMFWDPDIPRLRVTDAGGKATVVTVVAGALEGVTPLAPPPHSWAADPASDVAIWSIALEAGATWTVPPAATHGAARSLNVFSGKALKVAGQVVPGSSAVHVVPDQPVTIEAVDGPVEVLLLQGRPINEPVAQHGPFVMNTRAELEQAFADFRQTQFGGWPFSANDPVHPREQGRFAKHADGRTEEPK
jgi:redox-sensitive bicupin YhaK (pirin superfamily)